MGSDLGYHTMRVNVLSTEYGVRAYVRCTGVCTTYRRMNREWAYVRHTGECTVYGRMYSGGGMKDPAVHEGNTEVETNGYVVVYTATI